MNLTKLIACLYFFLILLVSPASSQGDTCATATPLTGGGIFPFDTTQNTTSNFGSGVCPTDLNQDAFWLWTAPVSDTFIFGVNSLGQNWNVGVNLWSGANCTPVCAGTNGSILPDVVYLLRVTAGDQFLIQVGGEGPSFSSGAANLTIRAWSGPCAIPDAFEPNNTCLTGTMLTEGLHSNLNADYLDDHDFFDFLVPAGEEVTVFATYLDWGYVNFSLYDSACAPVATDIGLGFTYANTSSTAETVHFQVTVDYESGFERCSQYSLQISTAPAVQPPPNNDCWTAIDIAGTGVFPIDNWGATSSWFDSGEHCSLASSPLFYDVFWQWTAPAASHYKIRATTALPWSHSVRVSAGLGCSADCSLELANYNQILWANAGDAFLIQTGSRGPRLRGPGNLIITPYQDPCLGGPDDSFENNDDCLGAAPLANGLYLDLFTETTDPDFYSFCVADGSTLRASIHSSNYMAEMDLVLWDAADVNCGNGSLTPTLQNVDYINYFSDRRVIWTNNTGSTMNMILKASIVDPFGTRCNTYSLSLSGAGDCFQNGIGPWFCDPANPNSLGHSAHMYGQWGSGVGSDLHLDVRSGVPGQPGYILVGNEASAGVPISNGTFCLMGTSTSRFYRYNRSGTEMNSIGFFDRTGQLILASGNFPEGFDVPSTIPDGPQSTIHAGDSWQFQCWYRDTASGTGTSNFSNGLSVTF